MADFQQIQKNLSNARAAHNKAEGDLFRVNEQLKQVNKQLEQMARWFNPNDQKHVQQRHQLESRKADLEGLKNQRGKIVDGLKGQLADIYPAFWDLWSDPRNNAVQMNDDIPIMLFPLRLETRFKTVTTAGAGTQHQLWVRIFPDECLIDTFEETLSEVELKSAGIFWREYFHAAGVEGDERAAWRGLVASHGSGRATWIKQHYRPLNPLSATDMEGDNMLDMKPLSKADSEVLLIVTAEKGSLTGAEQTALRIYWPAIWKADGDENAEAMAWNNLVGAVGSSARAEELAENFKPYNLKEEPLAPFTRATAMPRVVFVIFPKNEDLETKTMSWAKAAQANLLPERFVLLGYQGNTKVIDELSAPVQAPFHVSPNPTADTESQFQFDDDGNLIIGDELRWMLDFEEALQRGMAFRVNITAQQAAQGFSRLFVLGLRLSSDSSEGKTEVETLFKNHYFSRSGFAFLPQGSPTNNTEEVNSAYRRDDDADMSFDFVFKGLSQFSETEDWLQKRDGQWFAEALGLDTEWLKQIPFAGHTDQCEARAMNAALWPATFGYFMDTLMQPVFNDDDIYYTRWFFNRFVSGRGMIPAIRIGRQPYGILPTTAFSKISWVYGDQKVSYIDYSTYFQEKQRKTEFKDWLWKFYLILKDLQENTWKQQIEKVSRVDPNSTKDPHQELLNILGLHPASVEFYQRYANTQKQEHNIAQLYSILIKWIELPANELHNEAFTRLQQLGYAGDETPKLFDLFWKVFANKLNGPVIQDGPLSEKEALRVVTTNNRNYIEWLHEWATQSFDTLRVQDGFIDDKWPNALLYILLRHALQLGYHDAGVRAYEEAQLLDNQQKRALFNEPHFFQIQAPTTNLKASAVAAANNFSTEQSRYEILYSPNERITDHPTRTLYEHITLNLGERYFTRYLTEQLAALEHLKKTPTARLERLLAEHLDTASYRLDAWMTGLVNFQLASSRFSRKADPEGNEEGSTYRRGLYLGAYGWLENVKSENKTLTPVDLANQPELNKIFNEKVPAKHRVPLVRDDKNEGYIHAPSVNHATTAAILRNGYIANATPAQPNLLKVNLASERVRLALSMIEGIRNGQSLAALLGYQFERGLHDRYNFAECDEFIYPIRLVFPLYTRPEELPDGESIAAVEARNVVNGLNLIRHVKNADGTVKTYPFGFNSPPKKLPDATPAQAAIINSEINRLLDIYDALADLAIAEGVHQVVMGNYDRAAATLDAYSQATYPPVPEVVQTPRSGIGLTHRVALHFDANAVAALSDNPRAKAEPAMQQWANGILPAPTQVSCKVTYDGNPNPVFVTQAALGLQAIDLLYLINPDNLEARSELEDRVRDFIFQNAVPKPRPDAVLTISYTEGDTGHFTFFEIAPMIRSLRALLLRSRPLRSTDVALPTEAKNDNAGQISLARSRVDFLTTALTNEKTTRLVPLQTTMATVFPEPGPVTATILANIDNYLNDIITACKSLSIYGLQQTGFGIFYETKGGIFKNLLKKAADIAEHWQEKLNEYDALLATLPAQPGEPERIALLQKAELMISTTFVDTAGKTSAQVQAEIEAKKVLFQNRKNDFDNFKNTTKTNLSEVLTDFKNLLPVSDFDLQEVSVEDVEKSIVTLADDVRIRVNQLIEDLDKRIEAIETKLTAHDAEAAPDKKVQILTDAVRLVFGDEFALVPSFITPQLQAEEWANAYSSRAQLLNYQKTTLNNAFPVDDWLYGTARVREKMHHLENLTFLAEAFGTTAPDLQPVQLPYDAAAPWLALEFPPDANAKLQRENLLYTAIYPATGFDKTQPQCGLLLDEWTEVIPSETETTGIAFHFDKPNAEPPQAILLATPPQFNGAWQWDDLVATLHETLDMARLRAVEPQQLDDTELSVFLPATILATTWRPITIAADLAVVNNYVDKIAINQ
ncbi:MAG: hypothetical protein OHK0019_05000 [Saprospiraceae bacterium]